MGYCLSPGEILMRVSLWTTADMRGALAKDSMEALRMQLATEELAGGVTRVVLDGRMDIAGTEAVDLQMNAIGGNRKFVLVDMQKVSFLGSMGLRTIFNTARAIQSRGGKMVLFAPDELVARVLKTSGVDTVVPIHNEMPSAIAALQ
jgi:anti-anti-sigma factor